MTSAAEVCRYAADKFRSGEWKWAQGKKSLEGMIPPGCQCIETALYQASRDLDWPGYGAAMDLVRVAIDATYPARWNDARGRTKEQVIEALERAAA